MHLRFDGYLGFPGGLIESDESIISGVSREVEEELCIESSALELSAQDFVCGMKLGDKRKEKKWLSLYFFSKELKQKDFLQMEEKARQAQHFGTEILGNIRVPLHDYRQSDGFPRFLTHAFAGTAKQQLLLSLYKTGLLTQAQLQSAYLVHHQ